MTTNNKDLSVHAEYHTLSANSGVTKPSSDLNCVLRYNRNTLYKPMPDVDKSCMTIRGSSQLSEEDQRIQDPKSLRRHMDDICIADVARIVASVRSTSLISANVELRTMPLTMWNNAVGYVQTYVGIDISACVNRDTATDARSPAMTLGFAKGVLQMVGVAGYLAGVQPEMTARAGLSALVQVPKPQANMNAADQQRYDEMIAIAAAVRDSAIKPTDQLVVRACDLAAYADETVDATGASVPLPRLSDSQFTVLQYAAFCYAGFAPKALTVESHITRSVDTNFGGAANECKNVQNKFSVDESSAQSAPQQKSTMDYAPLVGLSRNNSRENSPVTFRNNQPTNEDYNSNDD